MELGERSGTGQEQQWDHTDLIWAILLLVEFVLLSNVKSVLFALIYVVGWSQSTFVCGRPRFQ